MRDAADVVIVGSGPAGAAAARGFADGGLSVLVLEAGSAPEEDRFAVMERGLLGEPEWPFPPYAYEMHGDDIDLNEFAIRKLGGSSLAWGAIAPRYLPGDFRLRTRHGVGEDWPLSYDELEPFYGAAERFLGVSGADDNPFAGPRSAPFPMPAFPMSETDRRVKEAGARLGVRFHSVPTARNSVPYDGRSACLSYSTCRSCPIGASFAADEALRRLVRGGRVRIRTDAEALRVEVDRSGAARRVVFRDAAGVEHAARGRTIVLATQAVENVRILLNSACPGFPDGLANRSGVLGRAFLEHPKFYLLGRVRETLTPYRQGFETATTSAFHDHARRGEYAGGRLLVRECAGPSVPQIALRSGHWGRRLRDEIRSTFGHFVLLGAFLEQLPYPENRVTLSPTVWGASGLPAPRVEFRLVREYEAQGHRAMRAHMERIFDALGAEDVHESMPPSNSGHYMGGHRMGRDPATSVTDSFLAAHDVAGLYLASGGAFPTSGVSNPTLTTVALVLRMVDRVLRGCP